MPFGPRVVANWRSSTLGVIGGRCGVYRDLALRSSHVPRADFRRADWSFCAPCWYLAILRFSSLNFVAASASTATPTCLRIYRTRLPPL